MWPFKKPTTYVVKRKLIISTCDVDEESGQFKISKKEIDLPDAYLYEKSDCSLIATLLHDAEKIRNVLFWCSLTFPEIKGAQGSLIDWEKTRRDHACARHGLFISSCPQTH